ncbi:MAG: nucleotidyl transferase AbiEii/AbiGii toxin family protein [Porticoccus sp.]|nr:nucleotidyl transferase AbiEii/AbiGii toxin family protein [Porticoccus sp.]MBQ0806842.1 nucleotidyl transferase AbiEii/AbiGii toxin family protein [Porticoccus sp.]
MSLDREVVEYLSRERGIDSAFIEKDWHAVRVLKALSGHSHEGITTIFTGGTSLSKGRGLLKRFSEDLDFRVRFHEAKTKNQLKKKKSAFRLSLIEALRQIDDISFDDDDVKVDGLGFKIQLTYPKLFDAPNGIRPDLQIEFSFTQPRLEEEYREITSFVAEYKNEQPEAGFLCLSPLEIAADKFSSLVWRVLKRNREDAKDDPAMLRHLHDLCALQGVIAENDQLFVATALESFAQDQERPNRQVLLPLGEAAVKTVTAIQEDALYRQEYEQFVDAMSYADDEEKIVFDEALAHFQNLAHEKFCAQDFSGSSIN